MKSNLEEAVHARTDQSSAVRFCLWVVEISGRAVPMFGASIEEAEEGNYRQVTEPLRPLFFLKIPYACAKLWVVYC